MLITEDEAKERWCPFARVVLDASGISAGNRFHDEPPAFETTTRCIASQCMAWRWYFDGGLTNIKTGETVGAERSNRGYCGLAGTP